MFFDSKQHTFDEKDKPNFDSGTGEVVIEYTGLAADQNEARSVAKAIFSPNGRSVAHYHASRTEDYYITSGQAIVMVDNQPRTLKPGDHIRILPNQVHQVINPSDKEELTLIVKCTPAWTPTDFHHVNQLTENNHSNRTLKPM